MNITFKYRKKEWTLAKEPYGYSLTNNNKTTYYSNTRAIAEKLLKEHLINTKDHKEFVNSYTKTCKELVSVLEKAVKALPEPHSEEM